MNQTTPTKPADLSIYELHSPEVRRQHRAEVEAYVQALRNIERQKEIKAEAIKAEATRPLTEDEYFQEAVKRNKQQQDKQAERAAAEKAAELARIDFLMSSPPVVEIMETNEYKFLATVINFASRGYTLGDNGIQHFGFGLFHCNLDAPTPTKKAAK